MLSNIKSISLLNQIFSPLRTIRLLKLINYNKSLQFILSIDIDTYREYANIYRIIDNSDKGKEYDIETNELKFEGEYKNKKRSGFGKEYSKGILIYEGEYKEGKQNGNGKKFDENTGELIFEWQLLNGKGKGRIKELDLELNDFHIISAYIYEEFLKGKINGKGKEIIKFINDEEYCFIGDFVEGKKKRFGQKYYAYENKKELVYEGEFKDDKRNGIGKEYINGNELIFEG